MIERRKVSPLPLPAVPEVTVNEDGYALRGERKVRSSAKIGVPMTPEAGALEPEGEQAFGLCVGRSDGGHDARHERPVTRNRRARTCSGAIHGVRSEGMPRLALVSSKSPTPWRRGLAPTTRCGRRTQSGCLARRLTRASQRPTSCEERERARGDVPIGRAGRYSSACRGVARGCRELLEVPTTRLREGGAMPVCPASPRPFARSLPDGLTCYMAATSSADPQQIRRPRNLFHSGALRWLRGSDLNRRPLGYEPNELPGCSTPR